MIDEAIKHVVDSLMRLNVSSKVPMLEKFALVAVGGYGRGELNPNSDIDLLFIVEKNIDPATDQFIQDMISILWGIGLDIGHSCRAIQDCLRLAKEDLTIQTSMIEMRFLTGNRPLLEKLQESLKKSISDKNIRAFLTAKLSENRARHESQGELVCSPEPDIKNGPGGLRDYHAALWAAAARFGCLSLNEIGDEGIISAKEVESFDRSVDFFLRIRNELHYISEKKADVLRQNIQAPLAASLGYRNEDNAGAVERFMRDYYLHATNIYNFSEIIYERCLKKKPRAIQKVIASLSEKNLGNGFYVTRSVLAFRDNVEKSFSKNPGLFLELFEHCRIHDLKPESELKRQVRLNLHLLDDAFLRDPKVKKFLFDLLRLAQSEKTLRLMNELGVLGRILPEFGLTHCLMKYDFYHRFTSDEHSLRMVRFLEHLENGEVRDIPELSAAFLKTTRKYLLKLACLLHSLAKDPGNPEQPSNQAALATLYEQLSLDAEEAGILAFLMENYYEMMNIAFHEEIHQPNIIREFSEKTGNQEQSDLLYLISYAELRAVAPDTWTTWKKFLLSELYDCVRKYFKDPGFFREKSLATQVELHQNLQKDFFTWEIEQHVNMMPEDYWMSASPETVAQHIRLIRELQSTESAGGTFSLHARFNETGGYHMAALCYRGKGEVFASLIGILTAKNMNILGAQIFLRQDETIITTLQVENPAQVSDDANKMWGQVEKNLRDILAGREEMRSLLANRKRFVMSKTGLAAIIPKIQIDNTGNPAYTVLRVEARDHIGMLYKIVKTLSEFGVGIHRAKIACRGGRGIDVFYISLRGSKILFGKLLRQIKERLINVLLIEKLEDMD